MLGTGEPSSAATSSRPTAARTVNVMTEVPAESDVSIKVSSEQWLIAERPMYFLYKSAWSAAVTSWARPLRRVTGTSPRAPRAATSTLTSACRTRGTRRPTSTWTTSCVSGQTVTRKDIEVKPKKPLHDSGARRQPGHRAHDDASGDFSFHVGTTKDTPVVVERSMYFNYNNSVTGGHGVMGAASPEKDWYFAEGTTRSGFDTYVCIANPVRKTHSHPELLQGRRYVRSSTRASRSKPAAGSRSRAHDDNLGIGRHDDSSGDFSLKVSASLPVVAERTSYFTYRPFWTGGPPWSVPPAPAQQWYFAEGCTRQGYDTYLCLANPGDEVAKLDINYFRGDNQTEKKTGHRDRPPGAA